MATHHLVGHIGEFHPDSEDWPSYVEHLELYFVANKIKAVCNTPHSLWLSDLPTHSGLSHPNQSEGQVVRTACCPGQRAKATHSVLHHTRFNSRVQQAGQMISEYVAKLQKIAHTANL